MLSSRTNEPSQPAGRQAAAAACVALTMLAGAASVASAADVVAPADGAAVPSRPTFTIDTENASAEVEWSRFADVLTAGSEMGSFVDRGGGTYIGSTGSRSTRSTGRLDSGAWYWRSAITTHDADYNPTTTWTPIRTMRVADEPPIFEGWTLRAQRIRPRRGCSTPVRLRGIVRADDNESTERLRLTLSLRAPGRPSTLLRGAMEDPIIGLRFDRLVCSRRSRFTVVPAVSDPAGMRTAGPGRVVRLPRP